jgi:hypothetical protein
MLQLLYTLIVVCAVLYCMYALRRRIERGRQKSAWRTMTLSCTNNVNSTSQASIFAIMLCRNALDATLAAKTIASMYENAQCPLHIAVGLYEIVPDLRAESRVLQIYQTEAKSSKYGHSFADLVRTVKVPASRLHGIDAAREFLTRHAYSGEAFICTVAAGLVFFPQWDVKLLESRRHAANPSALIVAPPCLPPPASDFAAPIDDWGSEGMDLRKISAAMGTIGTRFSQQKFMGVGAKEACTPSFLHVDGVELARLPRLSARAFARRMGAQGPPTPSLFWTAELSFAPAHAFIAPEASMEKNTEGLSRAAPWGEERALDSRSSVRAVDYMTSVRLWVAGWDFFTPLEAIASWASHDAFMQHYSRGEAAEALLQGYEGAMARLDARGPRSIAEFTRFSATDPHSGLVYARSQLGVTPDEDVREVSAKYGSQAGFHAEREAMLMELEDRQKSSNALNGNRNHAFTLEE